MRDAEPVDPFAEELGEVPPVLDTVAEIARREAIYRRRLALADAVAGLLAILVATVATRHTPTWVWVAVPIFAVGVAKVQGLYDRDDQVITKTNVAEWRTVLQSSVIVAMGLYLAWRLLTNANQGGGMRLFLLLTVVDFLAAVGLRWLARLTARRASPPERCVIVGDPNRAPELAGALDRTPGVQLTGVVPEEALDGSVAELRHLVEELGIQRLVIAPHGEPNIITLHLIQAAKYIGVRVTLVPTVMTAVGGFAVIEDLDGITLLGVPRFGLSQSSRLVKRIFDVIVALVALLVLSPLLLTIAAAILVDSRGGVLFSQERIGRHGRTFRILKFRSMVPGAEGMKMSLLELNEAGDGLFKIAADPRITRIGRHIRSTHLDELPQLLNVLRGEMSLVGPRPLVVEEDARVTGRDRHRVHLTPGITGPWQVKGPLGSALSEMAMLDYRYASNWSIWTDVDILLRTVLRVAGRGGH